MKIACCGLDCEGCEAFIAMKNDDDKLRMETVEKWSKLYNHQFKLEDINCTGCHSDGIKIGHCSFCEVRKCNIAKGFENCSECPDFACELVEGILKFSPESRKRLEDLIRN